MTLGSILMDIQVFEGNLQSKAKFNIKLPAVPRIGETITLPDDHYLVEQVCYQANVPEAPGKGYVWPDSVYYTIRIIVKKKFPEEC